jgi:uncharacterized protein with FMN-binding domain
MPPKTTTHRSRRPYAAIALTAAISPLAACAAPATVAPTPTPQETETTVPESSAYVDGQYSARGWYGSLPSHQDVTLTIDDGAVTEVQITTPAEDDTSLGYQQRFAQALPDAIIGRPLDEISIDRLAGASGCSEGFMSALAEIREAASKN